MGNYDRRMVTAPDWLKDFHCIAGECSFTCCQQWNIDVDPMHAESYTHLGDPELQSIMDHLLHRYHIRRAGMRKPELQYRFLLLNYPENRCPLLNDHGECRLQKKYGADILCDTCYFHPRTFWQIDGRTGMSACLSCPECARLALLDDKPVIFSEFDAELDPNVEWLETSLISAPEVRGLLRDRDRIIAVLCDLLQDRTELFDVRLQQAKSFLFSFEDGFREAELSPSQYSNSAPDSLRLMETYLKVFDPISEAIEKPAQGAAEFSRQLAGGREGFVHLLAERFEEGCEIMTPFLADNQYLLENFMVHCVFSDSFKQFHRYQNDVLTADEIIRHEVALLDCWYLLLRVQLAQTALINQSMSEELFLETVIRADRAFWHYPDWFARCVDRFLMATSCW